MDQAKENSFANVASGQKFHMIDLRPHYNFFECPDETVIGAAVRCIFPSDPALIFKPMSGRMVGCYRIAATTEPTQKDISLPRKKRNGNSLETIQIPLLDHKSSGAERREGTLITIVDGDMGPAHAIHGREFDSLMSQYGEVVMATKPQVNKDTNMLNGNRMLVVDTKSASNPLPNRIIVKEQSFLIKYKGKRWFCSSCNEEHAGACPYLKQF